MSTTDQLLHNARAYTRAFDKGDLPLPPARRIAVLACMDARLNPYGLLGLQEGDAHVIRNAGGVVTDDEIGSLPFPQLFLGRRKSTPSHTPTAACSRSPTTTSSAPSKTTTGSSPN